MSGRPKVKRYHYTKDGVFIKEYECENDVRKEYYPFDIGKRPLFSNNSTTRNYSIMPDETIITKERIGRKGIREINKRLNNEFLDITKKDKRVKAINLDNKVVAIFANIRLAAKLSGVPMGTIHHQVNKGKGLSKGRGLIFKYE